MAALDFLYQRPENEDKILADFYRKICELDT